MRSLFGVLCAQSARPSFGCYEGPSVRMVLISRQRTHVRPALKKPFRGNEWFELYKTTVAGSGGILDGSLSENR